MVILVSFLSYILFFSSIVFGGQELPSITDNECNPNTSSWTSWFNTQDPKKTNGNDIEDISVIRKFYADAARCDTVLNVEYSVLGKSNNDTSLYQTLINNNGVFCMGSPTSRCPDYSVRFCCPLQQQQQQCGQTFRQPHSNSPLRIVSGFEAVPHSLPWAVSLQYKDVHDCGGVIIDQWHILTAAHCLDYSDDLGNHYARVGAHNRLSSGQLMPIAELISHPTYDESRSSDDIGIIKLASPITFSHEVQPICLVDNVRKKIYFLFVNRIFFCYRLLNRHLMQLFMLLVGVILYFKCGIVQVQFFFKHDFV
jgi:hypothetical protein